jgi:hypothetical protein
MDYYSVYKKKEIIPFAITWMNLEDSMLSEIITGGQILCDSIHMRCLK